MFDLCGDDVLAKSSVGQGGPLDSKINRLRAVGCKNNFLRIGGVDELGQARAGLVQRIPRLEAKLVK